MKTIVLKCLETVRMISLTILCASATATAEGCCSQSRNSSRGAEASPSGEGADSRSQQDRGARQTHCLRIPISDELLTHPSDGT